MTLKIDVTGNRFGQLVVIKQAASYRGEVMWECVCDCGRVVSVKGTSLRSGKTKSCGCLRESATRENKKTHGMSKTKLYRAWTNMHDRCKASFSGRKYYYDKGIKVWSGWKDFLAFASWAKDNGYSDDLSLDRIDSRLDYFPGNCRWITLADNCRNAAMVRYHGIYGGI